MKEYTKVLSLQELPEGGKVQVDVDGEEIGLFRVDGKVYAINNICSHARAPLSDGELEGYEIACPLHGARFDIRTGEALTAPAFEPVSCYEVKIEGEDIYIAL